MPEMDGKKVSVIIPCYNAETTIDRCMESIVNQTIGVEKIEIILVDDASTDSTYSRLCEWEEKYSDSVMVIHCSENGKQGMARNIGMSYASGEFIGFADDDDYLEHAMLRILYDAGMENDCDVAVCQSVKHKIADVVKMEDQNRRETIIEISNTRQRLDFLKKDINIAIWNKLYRRSFLQENQIDFLPGYIYDDIYFTCLVKQYCKRIFLTNQVLYHHIISKTSVSYGAKSKLDRIGFMEVHIKTIEELRDRGLYEEFSEWYEDEFIVDYVSFVINYQKTFGELEDEIDHILRNSIVGLFPNWKNINIVKKMMQSNDIDGRYQKIIQKLDLIE